jgi:hypothetical protein
MLALLFVVVLASSRASSFAAIESGQYDCPVLYHQSPGSRLHCSAREDRSVQNHNLLMARELPSLFLLLPS